MLIRLAVAMALGAVLGIERELVHKEAGVRTEMLVVGGSAMFSLIGLVLPYVASQGATLMPGMQVAGFGAIANVAVGIGFLGAGLIVKDGVSRPHGLTTAALVWTTAAIGLLAGLGLFAFAAIATVGIALVLYLFRKLNVSEGLEHYADANR